ncbi:glycosyltransferase [Sphingomonas desiccabilis]|uniref:glycosyltransferase n=1 Tax=Sphingomonas desiccabilis TaxID=429134 RepID=UPI0013EDB9CA|nr:glycosyltransferase [Sphingomonas desiccabilis]MBB3912712.1 glycosyltransferase involved in cell wall biosynthesis [Sphingomonas desiccabilis]
MRICFLITGFADGGAQKQSIFLLNEFQKRSDIDVVLIHFTEGVHDELLERDGIEIVQLAVRSFYDWRIPFKLRRVLRRTRPDVLLSWLPNCDIPAALVRRAHPKLRWVMTERNSAYPLKDPRFAARRLLGRLADAVVANSLKGSHYWAPVVPEARRFTVPNIIQPVASRPLIDPPTVAIIGRLEPQKNVEAVVQAFVRLAARRSDVRFVIIGKGSLEDQIRAAIAGHDAIAYLGFCKDVHEQIGRASVIVTMSHREGLPNVVLEAVAEDRLVVASDIAEHREVLGPDYPFYVEERGDPATIAGGIEQALAHRGDTSALDYARGRLATMNAPAIADRYIEIFRQVCAEPN